MELVIVQVPFSIPLPRHRVVLAGNILTFIVLVSPSVLKIRPNSLHQFSFNKIRPLADETGYRLPNSTTPTRYDLELTTLIDSGDPKFSGSVKIAITVLQDTGLIVLNQRSLTITQVNLKDENDENDISIDDPILDNNFEFLKINVKAAGLSADQKVVLHVNFEGTLSDDRMGFYRDSYVDADGNQKWFAATNFEATNARATFPCYDEPRYRTPVGQPISIKITHGKAYSAFSNLPGTDADGQDGTIITTFGDSPPLSTWQISFLVSDFDMVNATSEVQGTDMGFRVLARPQAIGDNTASFALDASQKVLTQLASFLNVGYALPEIVQVASPGLATVLAGWGLTSFPEDALLYDSKKGTQDDMRRVGMLQAHVFAQQWFGGYVGLTWWDNLWLSKGFATLFEHFTADAIWPEYKTMDTFLTEKMFPALLMDSYGTARPMTSYVEQPTSITALYDDVAYAKSGSVLRMWMHALTKDTFAKGLNYYLNDADLKYKSATADDLARNMQKAANEDQSLPESMDFSMILNSWTLKNGYPVLQVDRTDDDKLQITQKRFLIKANASVGTDKWYIPYNFATAGNPDFSKTDPLGWLAEEASATISQSDALKWTREDFVVFNKQQTGYYRVNYDDIGWNAIIQHLLSEDYTKIHLLNRAQLIDDGFNLARAGLVSYERMLSLSMYLKKETDYIPWKAVDMAFDYLNAMLAGSEAHDDLLRYIEELTEAIYKRLGTESGSSDSFMGKMTRNLAIKWACLAGNDDCKQAVSEKFKNAIENANNDVEPDLKGAVYCAALRQAEKNDWTAVWNKLNASTDPTERKTLITALACSSDADTLSGYLATTVQSSDNSYKAQERNKILQAVYDSGPVGLTVAINFLDDNFVKINAMYDGPMPVQMAVNEMAVWVDSQNQLNDFKNLLDDLKDEFISQDDVDRLTASATENVNWISEYHDEIRDFFKSYFSSAPSVVFSTQTVILAVLFSVRTLFW